MTSQSKPPVIQMMAKCFRSAGVSMATNHPGFYSQALAAAILGDELVTSANERTAYALGWGASLGGLRTVVSLKNVGLNDAADPFLNSLMLGLNAALVVVVFDDTDVEQSQLRQDSRHYHGFLGGLWLEPATVEQAGRMAIDAVELSERFSSPVVLRITNRLTVMAGDISPVQGRHPMAESPGCTFKRQPSSFVVHPRNYHQTQAATLKEKTQSWMRWADEQVALCSPTLVPNSDGEVHVVVGSAATPGGVAGHSILHLSMLPVPARTILKIAGSARRIIVHEHGDPIVARVIAGGGAINPCVVGVSSGVSQPNREFHCQDLCQGLFAALREFPRPILVGDIGGHTMDSERSLDACLCYGSGVAVATGVAAACPDHAVSCVIGDGAWLHSGLSAVAEAVARGVTLLIVVLHNGGCHSTGEQLPPGNLTVRHPAVSEVAVSATSAIGSDGWAEIVRHFDQPGIKIIHLSLSK